MYRSRSNATCLMRPHLFYACSVVSRTTIICYIIHHKKTCVRQVVLDDIDIYIYIYRERDIYIYIHTYIYIYIYIERERDVYMYIEWLPPSLGPENVGVERLHDRVGRAVPRWPGKGEPFGQAVKP